MSKAAPLLRRLETALQDCAGLLVRHAVPRLRRELLEAWTTGGTLLPPARRWLFEGLSRTLDREYYAPAATTSRREVLKRLCMGEDAGVRWAESYCRRGFPDRFTPALAMFAELERLLASGVITSAHQVACCSGREIAYFARRYPAVRFRGSDVDSKIVEFCAATWHEIPNLDFVRLSLERVDESAAADLEADVVYASGGLHYMDPPSLRYFFARARDLTPRLLLSQPVDADFEMDAHTESRPRRQLSWNHPYARYLRAAKWREVRWSEACVEGLPGVKNVAVSAA